MSSPSTTTAVAAPAPAATTGPMAAPTSPRGVGARHAALSCRNLLDRTLMYMGAAMPLSAPTRMSWQKARIGASTSKPKSWCSLTMCPPASRRNRLGSTSAAALVNDVSLRNLIPAELAKQFGFYQSKPQTSLPRSRLHRMNWATRGRRQVALPLITTLNGRKKSAHPMPAWT